MLVPDLFRGSFFWLHIYLTFTRLLIECTLIEKPENFGPKLHKCVHVHMGFVYIVKYCCKHTGADLGCAIFA